jgi:hypothetical protein
MDERLIIKDKNISRILVTVLIGLQLVACNKSVRVPPSDYNTVNTAQAEYWRVSTTDKKLYWVEQFTVTDSTLVISQASRVYLSPSDAEPKYLYESDLPIVLELSEIETLERRATNKILTVAVVTMAALAVISFISFAVTFGGGWSFST